MLNRSRCVVLVPIYDQVERACEQSLQALEERGYHVRRLLAGAAIDVGRSRIATAALDDGYDELMWIDSDIAFDPGAVDALRDHGLPICAGLYPKKADAQMAFHGNRDTRNLTLGQQGGVIEVGYAATGFMYTQRCVYEDMQHKLGLPLCNETFGERIVPYFLPQVIEDAPGRHWYLAEDFSFCHRARQVGYRIRVDTSIRLWHIGKYAYSWEDACGDRTRYESFAMTCVSPERPGLGAPDARLWAPRPIVSTGAGAGASADPAAPPSPPPAPGTAVASFEAESKGRP